MKRKSGFIIEFLTVHCFMNELSTGFLLPLKKRTVPHNPSVGLFKPLLLLPMNFKTIRTSKLYIKAQNTSLERLKIAFVTVKAMNF